MTDAQVGPSGIEGLIVYRLSGTRDGSGAPLAQSAERFHGKEKVYGSIP